MKRALGKCLRRGGLALMVVGLLMVLWVPVFAGSLPPRVLFLAVALAWTGGIIGACGVPLD